MVNSMSLFVAGEILIFLVQMEIVAGAAEEILDSHSSSKEHSVRADRQYVGSLGTRTVDVLLATFLLGTQHRDHGEDQSDWQVEQLKKLMNYFLQSDYQYCCYHHHQSETELVDNFVCGFLHKMMTVEKPLLFL
jgi:hypothetical protein